MTCPPDTAVTMAALLGLTVLVGCLLAYALVIAIPRFRARRLDYLLPSRPINIPRRLK
jgi:hypothetical protein